jgi:hypothetical protein
MSWKQNITDFLRNGLRFAITACLFIDGIILSVWSVWFVGKFMLKLTTWIDRTIFTPQW